MTDLSQRPVRWGIAGPGRIATALVADFEHVEGAEVVAVGSRSAERAAAFAAAHGVARSYGSYRELIADPDIDVVYIATPHPQHHQLALACVAAGQAVLVEKAFAATLAGAQQIVDEARAGQVFAMEAMWTRFQPAVVRMRELIADGAIGEVLSVQVDLGVIRDFDPSDRLFNFALGGGAILDLGVYPISFAQMMLGDPDSIACRGALGSTGVEMDAAILLGYDNGTTATLTGSLHSPMPGYARVFGTAGWIEVLPRFHHPKQFTLHRHSAEAETFTVPPLGAGYSHELIEVTSAVRSGQLESAVMPLADTLSVQRIMEECLLQLGIEHQEAVDVL